uniref:YHS domain-containing protein n=1 Tax=Schlesneria paludicola TaxID=360056 RepID=A0A7C4LSL6_9PLAN
MLVRLFSVSAIAVLVSALALSADEQEKKAEFVPKCVVAGTPVKPDKTADYKGAMVQFCCDNCKGKFTAEPAKYQVAANLQLAGTGQFKQVKCPLSGQPSKADRTVDVTGVKVAFCCENCQAKVAEAKGDAQKELVFKNEAFDKAFELVKKDK